MASVIYVHVRTIDGIERSHRFNGDDADSLQRVETHIAGLIRDAFGHQVYYGASHYIGIPLPRTKMLKLDSPTVFYNLDHVVTIDLAHVDEGERRGA